MIEAQAYYSRKNYLNSKFSKEFLNLVNIDSIARNVYHTFLHGDEKNQFNIVEQLTFMIIEQQKRLNELYQKI